MSAMVSIRYADSGQPLAKFDAQQVRDLTVRGVHGFTVKRLQNRRPFIVHTARPYRQIVVHICTCTRATLDKLESLSGERAMLELDIPAADGGVETVTARLTSNIPAWYCGGHVAAEREIVIEFVECS